MISTFELQNPWRKPGYTFPEGRYIARGIFDRLFADLEKKEVTILIGSRQVGKTFLMNRLIRKLIDGGCAPFQIFYFNFDAFNLVELIQNDRVFFDFIRHYGHPGQRSYVFLDEAQRVPEIGLLLKRYYDLDLNIKFIVSGSSSLQIKSQVKETLTGRKHLFELLPISYPEFLSYKGHEPGETAVVEKFESDRYQMLLREFVLFGGYPGVVVSETPEDKIQLLKEIYRSYIQKDISDFLKIEDIPAFNRLVRFAASQAAGLCKVSEIGKNVRLSRYFVEKYLFALEETFIITFLRPYFVNLGKALVKTPKLYFHDTGIRNAVVGQFEPLNHKADAGLLVENFVFTELRKHLDQDRLWFYRTTAGTEVDFLYVQGDRVTPVECKYSRSRQKSMPRAFATIAENARLERALVVTVDYLADKRMETGRILFRPAWSAYDIPELILTHTGAIR